MQIQIEIQILRISRGIRSAVVWTDGIELIVFGYFCILVMEVELRLLCLSPSRILKSASEYLLGYINGILYPLNPLQTPPTTMGIFCGLITVQRGFNLQGFQLS